MTITRDVIIDLLPLYLAGEASADTRALLEEYLRDNPRFAAEVRERAARSAALLGAGAAAQPPPDHETATLERVRRFNRYRTQLLGFTIAYGLIPFAFAFEGSRIRWVMLRDNPKQAIFFWIAALGCWIAYYLLGRRLRSPVST
jgi:anti-sigma factor RsiW